MVVAVDSAAVGVLRARRRQRAEKVMKKYPTLFFLPETTLKKSRSPSKGPSTNKLACSDYCTVAPSSRTALMGSARLRHAAVQLEADPGCLVTSWSIYPVRAAPLSAPPRYPSHASPALTDSCSSCFSRAMTCCLPSVSRGLSITLVFGVAQTLLAFLRDLREPEDVSPFGMHRTSRRMWEWYCQVVCRM